MLRLSQGPNNNLSPQLFHNACHYWVGFKKGHCREMLGGCMYIKSNIKALMTP